jgi:hypothetical protein
MGHWNQDHMTVSYLHSPPVQGMSAVAGHVRGTYLLPRESVEPPQELRDLVWPWAKQEYAEVKKVCSCRPLAALTGDVLVVMLVVCVSGAASAPQDAQPAAKLLAVLLSGWLCFLLCRQLCCLLCRRLCCWLCYWLCRRLCYLLCRRLCYLLCRRLCQRLCRRLCCWLCYLLCRRLCCLLCRQMCQRLCCRLCCIALWNHNMTSTKCLPACVAQHQRQKEGWRDRHRGAELLRAAGLAAGRVPSGSAPAGALLPTPLLVGARGLCSNPAPPQVAGIPAAHLPGPRHARQGCSSEREDGEQLEGLCVCLLGLTVW